MMTYKRYALEPFGPALRMTGHRSWRYITTSGRWVSTT